MSEQNNYEFGEQCDVPRNISAEHSLFSCTEYFSPSCHVHQFFWPFINSFVTNRNPAGNYIFKVNNRNARIRC